MDELRNSFRNPPVSHRAAPLWVWNDLMSEQQIAFQLKELKNHGFGGAFVHPRPGLITDYLSEEWFDRWGFALKTAKELGGDIKITRFVRFAKGEGLEKREDNFAAEVASMMG